jgi:hypothetical protein
LHGKAPKTVFLGFSGLLYTKKPVCSRKNGKKFLGNRGWGLGSGEWKKRKKGGKGVNPGDHTTDVPHTSHIIAIIYKL